MDWTLTPEETAAVAAYIDEGRRDEHTASALDKILYAEGQIRRRLAAENATLRHQLERARSKVERLETKREDALRKGDFAETGLDSLAVAKCLLYYLQQKDSWRLTRTKVLHILFLMYASWLAGHRERLFVEHPVASEYGPQFWRVFKNMLSTTTPVDADVVRSMGESNAGVLRLCQNAAAKYCDYSEADLRSFVSKCPAYRNALPENNGGKWSGELSDYEIYQWKKEQSA